MLLRLASPTVTNASAALRPLPVSDRDKDAEILALRHQIMVLQWQLGADRAKFASEERAFPAALLVPLPRQVLRRAPVAGPIRHRAAMAPRPDQAAPRPHLISASTGAGHYRPWPTGNRDRTCLPGRAAGYGRFAAELR